MPFLLLSVPGKPSPLPTSAAELDERVGGRHPFHLQAVVLVLAAEERLVDERRVVEVPDVLVLVVEIADAGQEAPELRCDAVRHAP